MLSAGFQYYILILLKYFAAVKFISVVQDSLATIEINFVGDLMCHSTQYNYARINADSFDFSGVYGEVKNYFLKADLTIGNLETITAGKSIRLQRLSVF